MPRPGCRCPPKDLARPHGAPWAPAGSSRSPSPPVVLSIPPAQLPQRQEHPGADGTSAPLCSPSPANSRRPPRCPPWPSRRHTGFVQPRREWGSRAGFADRAAGALPSASSPLSFAGTPQPFKPAPHGRGAGSSPAASLGAWAASRREDGHVLGTSPALVLLQAGGPGVMPREQAAFENPAAEICPEDTRHQGGFCRNFSCPGGQMSSI